MQQALVPPMTLSSQPLGHGLGISHRPEGHMLLALFSPLWAWIVWTDSGGRSSVVLALSHPGFWWFCLILFSDLHFSDVGCWLFFHLSISHMYFIFWRGFICSLLSYELGYSFLWFLQLCILCLFQILISLHISIIDKDFLSFFGLLILFIVSLDVKKLEFNYNFF